LGIAFDLEKRSNMRFIGVTKDATTAGPGKRLELFLKGCIRGIVNPCEGCFNPTTWEFGGARKEMSVDEVVVMIQRDAWNKQVTFCGGEPLLQTRNLIKVCKKLKEIDPKFHIIIYTAYIMENLLNNGIHFHLRPQDGEDVREALLSYSTEWREWDGDLRSFAIATPGQIRELMQYIDIIVDGDYQHDKRIPTEKYMNDGMFVGSSNQRVIDTQASLKYEPKLVFEYADEYTEDLQNRHNCKACGHKIKDHRKKYCDDDCKKAYHKRNKEMKVFGGA
jgi:organic radical activating enzyme